MRIVGNRLDKKIGTGHEEQLRQVLYCRGLDSIALTFIRDVEQQHLHPVGFLPIMHSWIEFTHLITLSLFSSREFARWTVFPWSFRSAVRIPPNQPFLPNRRYTWRKKRPQSNPDISSSETHVNGSESADGKVMVSNNNCMYARCLLRQDTNEGVRRLGVRDAFDVRRKTRYGQHVSLQRSPRLLV